MLIFISYPGAMAAYKRFQTLTTLNKNNIIGEVGFEPTQPEVRDLQSRAALQLDRSPLITPYRPTDKTCQIFSSPLEGDMLYRHLHQKVFWTGVYLCSTAPYTSSHFWQPRFLTSRRFRHHSIFSNYVLRKGTANELIFYPLSELVIVYKPTNSPSFF